MQSIGFLHLVFALPIPLIFRATHRCAKFYSCTNRNSRRASWTNYSDWFLQVHDCPFAVILNSKMLHRRISGVTIKRSPTLYSPLTHFPLPHLHMPSTSRRLPNYGSTHDLGNLALNASKDSRAATAQLPRLSDAHDTSTLSTTALQLTTS